MQARTVFILKLVHSVIFLVMVAALGWILYAAIARRYDCVLVVALGLIFLEGLALLLNRFECPFTTMVRKHADVDVAITDLFLPEWCSRHTFPIATTIFVLELIGLAIGYFTL